MSVWMSTLRKGLVWHLIDGRTTVCGRFIGDPDSPKFGVVLTQAEAEEVTAAGKCRTCAGESVRWDPVTRIHPAVSHA